MRGHSSTVAILTKGGTGDILTNRRIYQGSVRLSYTILPPNATVA